MIRVALITDEGFPSGMATTNRNLSLIKGLEESGDSIINVYCVRATESKDNLINKYYKGNISKQTSFRYTSKNLIWPRYKIMKLFSLMKSNFLFIYYFVKDHRKSEFDIVLSTTESYVPNLVYLIICKLLNVKFILAIDEFPNVLRYPNKLFNFYKSLYINSFFKFYDGFIIMTDILINYYKQYMRENSSFIKIPMTVDPDRFISTSNIKKENEIIYVGNLGLDGKDGVDILIRSYAKVAEKYPNYKLILIGGVEQSDYYELVKLKSLVSELKLNENVIFTGRINREKIPEYLNRASILALSRPDSLQAQGGFPTKLGEYLCTGNPVVVTKVGEIPNYLIDGENSYLAEPDSVNSFADKLFEAIEDKNSKNIGKAGKKLVEEVFSYKVQGKLLYNYFLSFTK